MRVFFVCCLALALGFGLASGEAYTQRIHTADSRFCALITSNVSDKVQQMSNATKQDLINFHITPARYERLRLQQISQIKRLAALSPCHVSYTIPPDLLAS